MHKDKRSRNTGLEFKSRIIAADISLDIPTELAADSLELAMALSNLLENAIHGCEAVPKGRKKHLALPAVMWGVWRWNAQTLV